MHTTHRFQRSMSPVAIVLSILALVLAGAGSGYAAAKIGTKDIKDNAVTSAKVKNGTLSAADLVKEKRYTPLTFTDGGEGDCEWLSGAEVLPGIADPGYRIDRFGIVRLVGVAVGGDASGGDGVCDSTVSGQSSDGVVAILPPAARPATAQIVPIGTPDNGGGNVIIVGTSPLNTGSAVIPAGAVYWSGAAYWGVLLDGISYDSARSRVAPSRVGAQKLSPQGRALLHRIGLS